MIVRMLSERIRLCYGFCMAAKAYLMGIDNGGTVTKAALYDTAGREIAVASVKTEMLFPFPGHAEKNSDDLWAANVKVISSVVKKAGIPAAAIAAIAVTGHGNGMYLVDAEGKPAHAGINSADSRASSYVSRWYADGTFDKVLPRTCQSIWPAQPAALLAWFRDNEPKTLERTRWIFMCKDYIRWRLTGEAGAEVTDASAVSLMDMRTLRYDPRVMEAFGISAVKDKLPPLCMSGAVCGKITEKAAAETGLAVGTPVAGGLIDIAACAIGTGITSGEKLCAIAGSWSINEYIGTAPVQHRDLWMTTAYCMPGWWLTLEGSAASAGNLEWIIAELMDKDAKAAGGSVFETVNGLVAGVAPRDCEVLFLPFLYGSAAGSKVQGGFLGLHASHSRAHLLRAVYEGVAFSHRTDIERLLRHRGPVQAARLAGGAAKSNAWVQIFADVLQLPIELTACEELGTMGAAICAGVAAGLFSSFEEAAGRMVRVSRVVEPCRENAGLYGDRYGRYLRTIKALDTV
jgi:L-xylulokinase